MSDLQALHKSARTLILSLRDGIEQLEKLEQVRSHEQTAGLSRQLHDRLGELQRLAQKMDSLWRMQSLRESTSKRDIWKHKVEQVSEECDALGAALDKHGHRERRKRVEEAEREQLLNHTGADGNGAWHSGLDDEAQAMSHVRRSKQVLEETFQTGAAILTNMAGQRERLKSAQRKALDVLNSLGLSDSLLGIIDRRQRMDKWITYGGMLFICLLIGGLLWWRLG